ncbi:hypothetical protein [Rhodococcus sp. USK13]|uniref:hypothetical protein n=1 Tax=Rhodococcus sp. USK13 TaxID=2806442 RepID=UPI001BCB93EF|nr:hypothetical protein [Rhodococcus sp. USK13]
MTPPDRRAIADYLAALSETELTQLVAEARDTGDEMRAFARSIFGAEPEDTRRRQPLPEPKPFDSGTTGNQVLREGSSPASPRPRLAEREFVARLFDTPDQDNLPDYS